MNRREKDLMRMGVGGVGRVADIEMDKVVDMFKTKCIKPEMF